MRPPDRDLVRQYTHPGTVRALEAGQSVSLEAPGYEDTCHVRCPDCDRLVRTFTGLYRDKVLFEYGPDAAHPHRCGVSHDTASDSKSLALERVNRELAELAEQRHARAVDRYGWSLQHDR